MPGILHLCDDKMQALLDGYMILAFCAKRKLLDVLWQEDGTVVGVCGRRVP